ncbi:hypothetical protein DV515_00007514 [Chloebia gouldiae]|uniref:Uncharacterized protein n=1 Tax=Chloebia gouldiae TaxID=44316 RepID=A0A3L8SIG4_CHLGU|nr:hypothetical protein DV515_00007514 [Chloebia gouldiae]
MKRNVKQAKKSLQSIVSDKDWAILQQCLPVKTSWASLMGSNMGEAYQRNKAWSGPENFRQLSSSQKPGKSTEVESTEKYTTLCVFVPWMAHCTGLKCESVA